MFFTGRKFLRCVKVILLFCVSMTIMQYIIFFKFSNHRRTLNKTLGEIKNKRSLDIVPYDDDQEVFNGRSQFAKTRGYQFKTDRRVTYVDCRKLFQGDRKELQRARLSIKHSNIRDNKKTFVDMTRNCEEFIRDREYIMSSLTEEEENFPIAYSISLYHDVEHFEMLLRAIYRPQNSYCIHVDKKSAKSVFDAIKAIASCFPNVFLASKLFSVIWADVKVLEANIQCATDLYHHSNRWRYFINLSGQEFPLRTNHQIVKILKALNGANNIEGRKSKVKLRREFQTEPPHDIHLVKGSVNIAATRGFIEYMLFDQKAQDLLDWIGYTNIPDESFFSTLQFNSHLRVPGSPTELNQTYPYVNPFIVRFTNWDSFPCRGKYVRDICIFGYGDLPLLISRPEIIANKFHLNFQRSGLECMDELIYNETRDEYIEKRVFNTSWYGPRTYSVYPPRT